MLHGYSVEKLGGRLFNNNYYPAKLHRVSPDTLAKRGYVLQDFY